MGKKKHRHDISRDQRRAQFASQQGRRRGISWTWVIAGAAAVFVLTLLFAGKGGGGGAVVASGPEPAEALASGQDVSLAAALFDDGKARFYRYTTSIGREIQFFVLKSSDGVIRAAFDACDVCYAKRRGYRQQGDVMVCNNCGRTFRSVDVTVFSGGCNPGPLPRTLEGERLTLKAASLDLGAVYF